MKNIIKVWLNKPKRSDQQLLAQFFYADKELTQVATKLESLGVQNEVQRCSMLVNHYRSCQDHVLSILVQMMEQSIPGERANRDYYVKFPEEIRHDSLGGQLWFGAECLAAGSIILNQEAKSESMRPLAKQLTVRLAEVRRLARHQALNGVHLYPEALRCALRQLDHLLATFELSYVSAMVPVKSVREHDHQQDITLLFCETVSRALKQGYISQDMIDSYEPGLMFTIPRLAIVCGLLVFPEGYIKLDGEPEDMSELFRPFHSLLRTIRGRLQTLKEDELQILEHKLCVPQEEALLAARRPSSAEPLPCHAPLPPSSPRQSRHPTATPPPYAHHPTPLPTSPLPVTDPAVYQAPPPEALAGAGTTEARAKLPSPGESYSLGGGPDEGLPCQQTPLAYPDQDMSGSMQSDVTELEQLNWMFHRVGDEMSHLLCPSSQNPSPAAQRRVSASPRNFPRRSHPPVGRAGSSNWPEERFFFKESPDRASSLPCSPLLGVRGTSLSRQCVEAALQRSKNLRSRPVTPEPRHASRSVTPDLSRSATPDPCPGSRPATPDPVGLRAELIKGGGRGESPEESKGVSKVTERIVDKVRGMKMSATAIFNPQSPNLRRGTAKEAREEEEEDEEEESPMDRYCRLQPCECFRCPSAPPFEPDEHGYDCPTLPMTDPTRDQSAALVLGYPKDEEERDGVEREERAGVEREERAGVEREERAGVEREERAGVEREEREEVTAEGDPEEAGMYPSLRPWKTAGEEEKAELRGGDGEKKETFRTNTRSLSSSLGCLNCSDNTSIPDAQLTNHKRSRFHSNCDLLHRLFVCISGVADQLQSNYASDLRAILKTLFEVMTTKTVLAEEDNLRKASLGLCDLALEDCTLCKEWLTASPAADEDRQFEELPFWVPDEACSVCSACSASFTVIRRKHHCRSCGKIFCSRCSPHFAPLPRYGQQKPVRVCTHCYLFHVTPFYVRNASS